MLSNPNESAIALQQRFLKLLDSMLPSELLTGPWTQFHDMHSGGGTKIAPFERIYIQAKEDEAEKIFYALFSRNPHRVTCTCCGSDYSLTESEDLCQATGYERGCDFDRKSDMYIEQAEQNPRSYSSVLALAEVEAAFKHDPLSDEPMPALKTKKIYASEVNPLPAPLNVMLYVKTEGVLVITKAMFPTEVPADIPKQGFVWAGD